MYLLQLNMFLIQLFQEIIFFCWPINEITFNILEIYVKFLFAAKAQEGEEEEEEEEESDIDQGAYFWERIFFMKIIIIIRKGIAVPMNSEEVSGKFEHTMKNSNTW